MWAEIAEMEGWLRSLTVACMTAWALCMQCLCTFPSAAFCVALERT